MSHLPDINPVIDGIADRTIPMPVMAGAGAAMVLGFGGFAYGLFANGDSGAQAWGALLVAIVYGMAIAQGGIIFSVLMTATWGRWGRPLKRLAESFAIFLPIGYVALIVFLLGGLGIYGWNPDTILPNGPIALHPHSPEAMASKEIWLQPGFFIARQLIAWALLIALDFVYLRASFAPDMIEAKARLGDKAPSWWNTFTGGKTNIKESVESGLRTQSNLFPFITIGFAGVFSLVGFDLIMSLDPWWFSNMFGAWIAVSSFWLSLAVLGLVAMLSKDWLKIGEFVTTSVTHDLGKLMLAGCMFWAYTTYAQLLPIWYTDMPEETGYLLIRMQLPQWAWLSQTVAITCFLAPFTILLSRGIKKMRWPFAGVCVLIMVGIFLERTLLVMPQTVWGDTFPTMQFLLINVGTWIGIMGLFTLSVTWFLSKIPPLVTSDPYLEDHPWDVHVHSLDAHH